MPAVILAYPDIALFSDPSGTRVVLPRMSGQVEERVYGEARVLFEGDDQPTPFTDVSRPRSYQLSVRFARDEHAVLLALQNLFEAARGPAAPDPRLMLRTNIGLLDGLNSVEVVTVPTWRKSAVKAQVFDVSFTAYTVAYTAEV